MPTPKVIHQPQTQHSLRRGIEALAKAIAPTLGPSARRSVAQNQAKLEMLDDGGLIARRIIALADREEDPGAMLLRQALWRTREHVGDGAATTAVLYECAHREGLRFIAAGANPMRLRERLLELLPRLRDGLLAGARPLRSQEELRALAFSVCYDEAMAAALAEALYTVGRFGMVDIRAGHGRGMERDFVAGAYWTGGVQSKEMLRGWARTVAEMSDAAILVSDAEIEEPAELVPLMQLALRCGLQDLLLIVKSISDKGLSVVLDKRLSDRIRVVVVNLELFQPDALARAQADIALLAGGRPVLQTAGDSLESVRESDFGQARWVWADDKNFGFASGKGDPRQLRDTVRRLRDAYDASDDDDARARMLERLGKLNGGLATVYVGGVAEDEIRQRKEIAERTVRALRNAIADGAIAGGGVALLGCRDWLLKEAAEAEELESRAARRILAAAAEAPIRQLLVNAGQDPSEVLARLAHCEAADGFDVMQGALVDVAAAGIFDVARVQAEALQRAISSAALALTIDVLVLHREPETMTEP